MPQHPDTVTVGVPTGAHLLRRLDAVASDLGMDRPEAIHTALLHWLEQLTLAYERLATAVDAAA